MNCKKQMSHPRVTDCQQCEYQDICKMESIINSANEISNINTENTKSVLNRIEYLDKKAEQKVGPLWNPICTIIYTIILGIILTIISYACNGYA